MYPAQTGRACEFLSRGDSSAFAVDSIDGITFWDEAKTGMPRPTEQTISDAINDLVTVDGKTFSEWHSVNGGDPTLTAKRLGKEMIEGSTPEGLLQRAVLQALINAIQAGQLKEGSSVTKAGIINALKNEIDAE